jgi:RNA polymerase primary sigma factor
MTDAEEVPAMHPLETVDLIVRTSREMVWEIGREPTPDEVSERLGIPPEKVHKVLKISKDPILLGNPYGPRHRL